MTRTEEKVKGELSRLIEMSCSGNIGFREFSQFHKAIIKIAYNAIDISFDYDRRRVHMNILVEDCQEEQLVPQMPVNLTYRNLSEFLKACIFLDKTTVLHYTYLLMGTATNNKISNPRYAGV